MKRSIIYSVVFIGALSLVISLLFIDRGRFSKSNPTVLAEEEREAVVAAPGRVEPVSEEINIGSEIPGKLKAVRVEEGDRVAQGQIIAELVNDDYLAQVASAEARLKQKEAELRLVINGARHQERREAWESVREAEAMLENARAEMERRRSLFEKGVIAREESDRAEREYKVARAKFEAASQRHDLIADEAREEDRAKAEADVALARAQLAEARARLEKTFIRSPLDAVVLRKHLKTGETVSEMRESPVVTIADISILRVRADVDETDVNKVEVGQNVYVTADAYGGKRFWGRVIRIGQVLGKKNIRTDEPTERVDTKILETLVELERGTYLPPGLRVDTFIVVGKDERRTAGSL